MKNEIDLSYKYCKENQILLEKDQNHLLIKCTDDTKVPVISYLQRHFKMPINLSKISQHEFNRALAESFSNNAYASKDLIEYIDVSIDLDSLISNLP